MRRVSTLWEGFPPGNVDVTVEDGETRTTLAERVEIVEKGTTLLDFDFPEAGTMVEGVVMADGVSASNADVWFEYGTTRIQGDCDTRSGAFHIENIPAGSGLLCASLNIDNTMLQECIRLDMAEDTLIQQDIEFRGRQRITDTVVGGDAFEVLVVLIFRGANVPRLTEMMRMLDSDSFSSGLVYAELYLGQGLLGNGRLPRAWDGHFEVSHLREDRYTACVMAANELETSRDIFYTTAVVDVEKATPHVELDLNQAQSF